jgi:hypothetical protein
MIKWPFYNDSQILELANLACHGVYIINFFTAVVNAAVL